MKVSCNLPVKHPLEHGPVAIKEKQKLKLKQRYSKGQEVKNLSNHCRGHGGGGAGGWGKCRTEKGREKVK